MYWSNYQNEIWVPEVNASFRTCIITSAYLRKILARIVYTFRNQSYFYRFEQENEVQKYLSIYMQSFFTHKRLGNDASMT